MITNRVQIGFDMVESFKFLARTVIFCMTLVCSVNVIAVQPDKVGISSLLPSSYLGEYIVYAVDIDGSRDYQGIKQNNNITWYSGKQPIPSFGFTNKTYWLAFNLLNDTSQYQELLLVLGNPLIDSIEIYDETTSSIGQVSEAKTLLGDNHPFNERLVEENHFLYPIKLRAGESRAIYLRVQSTSSIQLPLTLWERNAYYESKRPQLLFEGIVYGVLITVFFYNAYMYLLSRQSTRLHLSLLTLMVLLFIASHEGIGYSYLWPNQAWWNERSIVVFLALCSLFLSSFFFGFLDIGRKKDIRNKTLMVCIYGAVIVAIMGLVIPYSIMIRVASILFMLTIFSIFYFGVSRLMKGRKGSAGHLLSVSWLCVLPFFFLAFIFNKIGLFSQFSVDQHILLVISAVTVMLLTMAVSEKLVKTSHRLIDAQKLAIEHERISRISSQDELSKLKDNYEIDRQMMEANRKLARQLENRVVVQERQIEEVSEQLESSSILDKATGLSNKESFMSFYQSEWRRSARGKSHLSLLAIELDWSEGIAEQFGEVALQKSLLYLASILPKFAQRPSDIIARYDGTTFMVLMPDTDAEGAWLVAERIRSGVEKKMIKHNAYVFSATISVGVSSVIPSHHHLEDVLITASQKALYDVQKSGKNSVKLFES